MPLARRTARANHMERKMTNTCKHLSRQLRGARRSLRHTAEPTSLRHCGADARAIRLALRKEAKAAQSRREA